MVSRFHSCVRFRVPALGLVALCIAACFARPSVARSSPRTPQNFRGALPEIRLSLRHDYEEAPPSQRWLALRPLADLQPETVWGIPRAWLHGLDSLADIDRVPMPLGGVNLRTPHSSVRVDGLLSMNASYPAIGGHFSFDVGLRHYDFTLPSVQIVPQMRAGGMFCAVNVFLVDRKF